jgi:hypothetical protein
MENLNIAHLIEKNSITRLTKDYENKFLMKIKENFNDNQQQLFVASFYCFLNYDKKNDFVIDFDNVWKWLGFTRKDNSKRLLEKFFTEDIDYKIVFLRTEENLLGGRPRENIMLNINTFKKFCLKAGTKKADEVHDYYIKLEELLQETIDEETNELRLQLTNKEEEKLKIEEENLKLQEENVRQLNRVKLLEKKNIKRSERTIYGINCVYVITNKYLVQDRTYIVGKAVSLTERLSQYNKMAEHDVVHYVECNNASQMSLIEKSVLYKLNNYRERADRDRFILPENKDISFFTNILNEACEWFKDVGKDVVLESVYDEREYYEDNKEYIKEYKRQHYEENKEEITIKNKEWYENNKEKMKLYIQEYREENKERLPEQKKIYRQEHKEEFKERDAKYYQENKEEIQRKNKAYQEENRDAILKQRKEYYNKNIEEIRAKDRARNPKVVCECGLSICLRSIPAHKKTKIHQTFMAKINTETDEVVEV